MSKIYPSPHADIEIPNVTLPDFLLLLDAPQVSGAHLSAPIYYPASNAPRVLAKEQAKQPEGQTGVAGILDGLRNITNQQVERIAAATSLKGGERLALDFDNVGPVGLVQIRNVAERVAVSLLTTVPGFKKGSVVAFYSPNQHDYISAVLGVQLAGGIAALCNPAYKPWELATQLRKIQPLLILGTAETYESAAEAISMAASEKTGDEVEKLPPVPAASLLVFDETHSASWEKPLLCPPKEAWARKQELFASVKIDPATDAAAYCFSSGTSGLPKALALTHRNLIANCLQLYHMLTDQFNVPLRERNAHGDASANKNLHVDVLPTFHAYGMQCALVALYTGTPRVVLGRFNLQVFLSSIEQRRATFAFIVPPILLAFAKHPDVDNHDLSSLRRVMSGAAILSRSLLAQVKARLDIVITDGYGMSEMSPVVCVANEQDSIEEPESIGFLAPSTRARIVSPEGQDLGPDEEGELVVQGPQMMTGYLNNDEANKSTFTTARDDPDCWLRTGDTAKISKAGRVTLTGRTKDIIKMSGFQVSPKELEDLLFREKEVADVAVVGVREEDGSEIPWAFVVPSKEAAAMSEQERSSAIMGSVNTKVAYYKKIRGVTWLEALPKSESGKVLKRKLERPPQALVTAV